jgi:hypothetical protein
VHEDSAIRKGIAITGCESRLTQVKQESNLESARYDGAVFCCGPETLDRAMLTDGEDVKRRDGLAAKQGVSAIEVVMLPVLVTYEFTVDDSGEEFWFIQVSRNFTTAQLRKIGRS